MLITQGSGAGWKREQRRKSKQKVPDGGGEKEPVHVKILVLCGPSIMGSGGETEATSGFVRPQPINICPGECPLGKGRRATPITFKGGTPRKRGGKVRRGPSSKHQQYMGSRGGKVLDEEELTLLKQGSRSVNRAQDDAGVPN